MRSLLPVLFTMNLCLANVWMGDAMASSVLSLPFSVDRPSVSTISPPARAAAVGPVETGASVSDLPASTGPSRTTARPAEIVPVTKSVIAMGEPAVSFDKVAAIGDGKDSSRKRDPHAMPMVIRGGVTDGMVGHSGPASAPAQQTATAPASQTAAKPTKPAAAPKPAQQPDAPAGDFRKPE